MLVYPLRKDFSKLVNTYIENLGLNPKRIFVHVDIQNLSIGKYDAKISEDYFVNDSFNSIMILKDLLMWISIKHNELYHETKLLPVFVLYTDKGRNIFNQNFVSTWKEDRKKSYTKLKDTNPTYYQICTFASTVIDQIVSIMEKFINYSTSIRLYNIPNIDSDLIPMIYYYKYPNDLHVIVSSDHDYYHMLNESDNIIRYIHLERLRQKYKYTIEHRYNSFLAIQNKYNIKDTNQSKHVAKYYQIYHGLIGDSTDNVKSLIKRKSIKYWIKRLYGTLDAYTIHDLRSMILNDKCFIEELLDYKVDDNDFKFIHPKPKNKWDEFRMRQFIFDFYYLSQIVLDDSKEMYSKFIKWYPYQKNVLDDVIQSIHKILDNKVKWNQSDMYNFLQHIGIDSYTSDYISKSICY